MRKRVMTWTRKASCLAVLLLFAGCSQPDARSGIPAPLEVTDAAIGHYCGMALVEHPGPKRQILLRGSDRPVWFSSARDAIALEVLSKEFWRVRLRAKSAYNLQYADQFNPWSYRVGVEWQPPLFRLVEDPTWRNRIKNRITVDAAVFTDPSHSASGQNEDPLRRRVGLNYNYDWWGYWWSKPRPAAPRPAAADSASRKAAGRDDAR